MKTLLNNKINKIFIMIIVFLMCALFAGFADEAIYIDANGNVGIGTTSPNYTLDVNGNINFTGTLYQNGNPYGGGSSAWSTSGANIYYNNGNVGIGTTSPEKKLEINGGDIMITKADARLFVGWGDNGINSGLQLEGGNTTVQTINFRGSRLRIYSSGNGEKISFLSNGNVGIGTTSPGERLHVNGKIRAENVIYSMSDPSYTPATELRTWGINKADGHLYLEWGNSDGDNLYITDHWRGRSPVYMKTGPIHLMAGNRYGIFIGTNGNVGIGTTNPSRKLFVNGDAGGTTGWYNDSHSSYKENFKKPNVLAKIKDLNIKEWQYKKEHTTADNYRHISPFAEDFYEKFGLGNNDAQIQALDVAGVALKAVQEQQQIIEKLQKEIKILQSKNINKKNENLLDKIIHLFK